VVIVPPPAPSVIKIRSPTCIFLLANNLLQIPIALIPPTNLLPITISPPILNVEPAVIGTFAKSEIVDTPAIKSNNLPTSASSPRWLSIIIDIGFAPLTYKSLKAARVT